MQSEVGGGAKVAQGRGIPAHVVCSAFLSLLFLLFFGGLLMACFDSARQKMRQKKANKINKSVVGTATRTHFRFLRVYAVIELWRQRVPGNWFPNYSSRFPLFFSSRNGPAPARRPLPQPSCQRQQRYPAEPAHALPRLLQAQPRSRVSIRPVDGLPS